MAIKLQSDFIPNKTWFRDTEQLPGWTIEWQMAASSGGYVVSALRIAPTPKKAPTLPRVPGFPDLLAVVRHGLGFVDGPGITPALLRKVRLGVAAKTGRYAMREQELPATRRKPLSRRGAPTTITNHWWKRLNARYTDLRAEGCRDYAKVLAEEFGLSRGAMRTRISRGIADGWINGEYVPPPSATRVQRNRRMTEK